MPIFTFEITETFQLPIKVEGKDEHDALMRLREAYQFKTVECEFIDYEITELDESSCEPTKTLKADGEIVDL